MQGEHLRLMSSMAREFRMVMRCIFISRSEPFPLQPCPCGRPVSKQGTADSPCSGRPGGADCRRAHCSKAGNRLGSHAHAPDTFPVVLPRKRRKATPPKRGCGFSCICTLAQWCPAGFDKTFRRVNDYRVPKAHDKLFPGRKEHLVVCIPYGPEQLSRRNLDVVQAA